MVPNFHPKIIYIANIRIPTERANGIQIAKTLDALKSLGADVCLVAPWRVQTTPSLRGVKSFWDYYGLKERFPIVKLPSIDMTWIGIYLRFLAPVLFFIQDSSFAFSVFFCILFKKADIIYSRDIFSIFFPSFFKNNLICEVHAFPANYFLYSGFFKRIRGIVVITNYLKELFAGRGVEADKILVASDGVDLRKFEIRNSKLEIREKLGLPKDKKIALYTGHLYEWKGVQILADASRYLPDGIELYFVGGTEEDIKKFKIKNLKILPTGRQVKINVVGHRPHQEIPYWLKAADVLVLPNSAKEEISKHWTSPIKMFEYMASQGPIVASDLPSIREVLNENNAILVKPDNPQDLAEGIKKTLNNRELADMISGRAFQDVQNYSWEKRAGKILRFICQKT